MSLAMHGCGCGDVRIERITQRMNRQQSGKYKQKRQERMNGK